MFDSLTVQAPEQQQQPATHAASLLRKYMAVGHNDAHVLLSMSMLPQLSCEDRSSHRDTEAQRQLPPPLGKGTDVPCMHAPAALGAAQCKANSTTSSSINSGTEDSGSSSSSRSVAGCGTATGSESSRSSLDSLHVRPAGSCSRRAPGSRRRRTGPPPPPPSPFAPYADTPFWVPLRAVPSNMHAATAATHAEAGVATAAPPSADPLRLPAQQPKPSKPSYAMLPQWAAHAHAGAVPSSLPAAFVAPAVPAAPVVAVPPATADAAVAPDVSAAAIAAAAPAGAVSAAPFAEAPAVGKPSPLPLPAHTSAVRASRSAPLLALSGAAGTQRPLQRQPPSSGAALLLSWLLPSLSLRRGNNAAANATSGTRPPPKA